MERLTRLGLVVGIVLGLFACGCAGPGHFQFEAGRCSKDGEQLTLEQVEAEQANVAQRIASRQPWFAVITIGIVLVAAGSNLDRVLVLFRARQADGAHRPLAERLRDALARQREKPARFGLIVGGSLALVLFSGGAYVYLDVDRRVSERALGMLQFCHLAMRTQQEEGVLDQQRKNLDAIQSTAGDIRTLVGKLPPDEQKKAQQIVSQMNDALARQGKIVGDYASRTDEAQKDLAAQTSAMEKGLATVQGNLEGLRSLPATVKELETATHRIDQATGELDGKLGALDSKVDTLLARPACSAAPPSPPPKSSAAPALGGDGGLAPAPK